MSKRYSQLERLSPTERANTCIKICNFFSPLNTEKIKQELGLTESMNNSITPLAVGDFFNWSRKMGLGLEPKHQLIRELIILLAHKGVLTPAGQKSGVAPGRSDCYYFMHQISKMAQKGTLWLGDILGADFIANEVRKITTFISGVTSRGDIAIGTGIHVLPGVILTCAHVIEDLENISAVSIENANFTVESTNFDGTHDVGIIKVKEVSAPALPDISFRSARILEEIVIAGYPSIPRGLAPTLTVNRGEICGKLENSMDQMPLELFSAIARPGNSGGPVIALDGRIVGMVTRSLERFKEDADAMSPLPFFAAVPSNTIREIFCKLTNGVSLPWEDYD